MHWAGILRNCCWILCWILWCSHRLELRVVRGCGVDVDSCLHNLNMGSTKIINRTTRDMHIKVCSTWVDSKRITIREVDGEFEVDMEPRVSRTTLCTGTVTAPAPWEKARKRHDLFWRLLIF